MNEIFKPYLLKFVVVFFDDILVYNKGFEDHLWYFRVVLNLLKDHRLVVNQKKYSFGQDKINYLEHLVLKKAWKWIPRNQGYEKLANIER